MLPLNADNVPCSRWDVAGMSVSGSRFVSARIVSSQMKT